MGLGSEKDERDEQKSINRKENSRDKKKKIWSSWLCNKEPSPNKKKREKERKEKESKRRWGREWKRVRACKKLVKIPSGWVKRKRELFIGWVMWGVYFDFEMMIKRVELEITYNKRE